MLAERAHGACAACLLAGVLLCACARDAAAITGCTWVETEKLPVGGINVALSAGGSTLVTVARGAESAGGPTVFTRISNGTWASTTLVADDGTDTALASNLVAISGDGSSVACIDSGTGETRVFERSDDGMWAQVGSMPAQSGDLNQEATSVALSGAGSIVAVGNANATWIFTRSADGSWTQAATKLVRTNATSSSQVWPPSLAMSADGSTVAVGDANDAYDENEYGYNFGATWVFSRAPDGVWAQVGPKLVGSGSAPGFAGNSAQGSSVAISADATTLVVGGAFDDDYDQGATWIFTRSTNGDWVQAGSKLVGSGSIGGAQQGRSVAVSADGAVLVIGGPADGMYVGATWVFTLRNDGTWTQMGNKLVGSSVTAASQGESVAISADGSTIAVMGPEDDEDGSTWIFMCEPDDLPLSSSTDMTTSSSMGAPMSDPATESQPTSVPNEGRSRPRKPNYSTIGGAAAAVVVVAGACLFAAAIWRRKCQARLAVPPRKHPSAVSIPAMATTAFSNQAVADTSPRSTSLISGDKAAVLVDVSTPKSSPSRSVVAGTVSSVDTSIELRGPPVGGLAMDATTSAPLSSNPIEALTTQLNFMHRHGLLLARRYKLLGPSEQRSDTRHIVRLATHAVHTSKRFTVKFFIDRRDFEHERHLYADPATVELLAPTEDICLNEDEPSILGRPLPPMIVTKREESLVEYAQRNKPDFFMCLSIIGHLAHRVESFHAAGLVHGDLRPGNIIWLPSNNEFTVVGYSCMARVGTLAPIGCTLDYAPPEAVAARSADERHLAVSTALDVWALGVIFFEFLTACRVFEGGGHGVFAAAAGRVQYPWEGQDAAQHMRRLGFLRPLILAMLRREPAARISMADFCSQLKHMLQWETLSLSGAARALGAEMPP